jgi:hypothetical protein
MMENDHLEDAILNIRYVIAALADGLTSPALRLHAQYSLERAIEELEKIKAGERGTSVETKTDAS